MILIHINLAHSTTKRNQPVTHNTCWKENVKVQVAHSTTKRNQPVTHNTCWKENVKVQGHPKETEHANY